MKHRAFSIFLPVARKIEQLVDELRESAASDCDVLTKFARHRRFDHFPLQAHA
jgi:hypothetical protein